MNKLPSIRTPPRGQVDGSKSVHVKARALRIAPSISADACHASPELDDRIAIWVNEGGAGGEVERATAI